MKLKPIFNTIIKTFKRKSPYVLLSKETGLNPDSGKIFCEQLSLKKAEKVDYVVIANRKNPEQKKIITTFRDKDNGILERVFEYEGYNLPTVHKLYKKIEDYWSLPGRLIQTFEDLTPKGICSIWQKVATEKQFVHRLNNGNKKTIGLTLVKVSTKERTMGEVKNEVHSFSRHLLDNGKICEPRFLIMNIEKDSFGVPMVKSTNSYCAEVPVDDEYLAYRAYDADDVKIPLTKMVLRKLGLQDLNIKVKKSYVKPKSSSGFFDWKKGIIEYPDEVESKHEAIDTVFHETHHAFQYAIMSLFCELDSKFTDLCRKKLKIPKTKELKNIAQEYLIAHTNYVPPSEDYEKYYNNLLEQKAREIAKALKAKYFSQSKKLSIDFSLPRLES